MRLLKMYPNIRILQLLTIIATILATIGSIGKTQGVKAKPIPSKYKVNSARSGFWLSALLSFKEGEGVAVLGVLIVVDAVCVVSCVGLIRLLGLDALDEEVSLVFSSSSIT